MEQEITKKEDIQHLSLLGNQNTKYLESPNRDILETFQSPSRLPYYVTFRQKGEFTSKCPKTSQPDFGNISIFYKPKELCVESKSLKLYLFSFRDSHGFGEAITNRIADDLFAVLSPYFLVVIGDFAARGGISWGTKAIRHDRDYGLGDLDLGQIRDFNS